MFGISTENGFGISIERRSARRSTYRPCRPARPPYPPYEEPKRCTCGTPCVAAHSLVRALCSSYGGPLSRVERAFDGAAADIGLSAAGGYANAAAQDSFCSGTWATGTTPPRVWP
ncbi:arabinofuranosidase catalytic domain-containing protein [Streptomyces sp. NPDC048045]|uniref:arabinofuranosidase catalytic domain-containing protein n=1 Tax=Streptomyces sp. NPDC048045 TaxID=3154710 RepID=UPI00341E9610